MEKGIATLTSACHFDAELGVGRSRGAMLRAGGAAAPPISLLRLLRT